MHTKIFIAVAFIIVVPASAQLALIRQGRESKGTAEEGEWHGAALAMGDFNGDGYDDLAAGAPFEDSNPSTRPSGAVIVNPGTPWGLSWKGALYLTPLDAGLETAEAHQMGAALAAGDFNNDGFDDLALGLPASSVNSRSAAGRVLVYMGSGEGLSASASIIHQGQLGAAIEGSDAFGSSLAAGRLGDDAYADLVVGATGENEGRGAVFVIRGGALGLNTARRQILLGEDLGHANQPNDRFGAAVLIANIVGFPAAELIVGAPFAELTAGVPSSGLVYIANSSDAAISTTSPVVVSAQQWGANMLWFNGRFGSSLAAGDFWGDGNPMDLAIGAPGSHTGGRVFIGRGSPLGLSWPTVLAQPTSWGPDEAGDGYGSAVAAGDHDGDGDGDLAVGAPGQDVILSPFEDSGALHIHDGGPTGPGAASANWFDLDLGDEVTGEGQLGYAVAAGRTSAAARHSFCVSAPRKFDDMGQVFDVAPWRQVMRLLCRSALAADCENNIVYALRPFQRLKIASTTKTMTTLLACEATERPANDPLRVGIDETYTIESWMFDAYPLTSSCSIFGFPPAPVNLLPQTFTLRDLMHAIIFPSGNDACYAFADMMTGEISQWGVVPMPAIQFVALMNARGAQLGMKDTLFTNPAGTDINDPYSSAYDMWLLSRAAMANPLFRSVASATDYPIQRVLLGAEAGMFSTAMTNLSYGWLKDLKAIDSRLIGIKPGGTPGAKSTGVVAARFDAAGTKLAFANGFRFSDSGQAKKKLVALAQLGLSFCNVDLDPPTGLAGPVSQSTWQANDDQLQAMQWGGFGQQPDNAAPATREWIQIDSTTSSGDLARYPLHLHTNALWELPAGQQVKITAGPLERVRLALRLQSEFSDPPPSTAAVVLTGSLFSAPQTLVLSSLRDTVLTRDGTGATDTLSIENAGPNPIWISGALFVEIVATSAHLRFTFLTDRASTRCGYILAEAPRLSPRDSPTLIEIVVQDRVSGLRYHPPMELSNLRRRAEIRPDMDELTLALAPTVANRLPLTDFLGAVDLYGSRSLGNDAWEHLERVTLTGAPPHQIRLLLPASPHRFLRAQGVPTEK
ncbi:MAG: hypothetical protein ACKV19_27535 [Verrucomicrobiales bacterium]